MRAAVYYLVKKLKTPGHPTYIGGGFIHFRF
jgi:hypothetical protein